MARYRLWTSQTQIMAATTQSWRLNACCGDSKTKAWFNIISETQKCIRVGGQMGINRCIVVDNSERYAGVELPVLKRRHHFTLLVRDLWHYNRISGASSRIYWPSTTCTNGTGRKMWSSNTVSRLSYTCTSLKLEILCAAYTRGSSPTSPFISYRLRMWARITQSI